MQKLYTNWPLWQGKERNEIKLNIVTVVLLGAVILTGGAPICFRRPVGRPDGVGYQDAKHQRCRGSV